MQLYTYICVRSGLYSVHCRCWKEISLACVNDGWVRARISNVSWCYSWWNVMTCIWSNCICLCGSSMVHAEIYAGIAELHVSKIHIVNCLMYQRPPPHYGNLVTWIQLIMYEVWNRQHLLDHTLPYFSTAVCKIVVAIVIRLTTHLWTLTPLWRIKQIPSRTCYADTVKISSGGLCGVVSTGTRLVKRLQKPFSLVQEVKNRGIFLTVSA